MYVKNISLLIGFCLCGAALDTALAAPVLPPSFAGSGMVQMVDGKDANAGVTVVALILTGNSLRNSVFDFGYMNSGSYLPITDACCGNSFGNLGARSFFGGTVVDFAVRYYGSDKQSGTSDDKLFRLSDTAGYSDQRYFGPINPSDSRNPVVSTDYYRALYIGWDLNRDGRTDVRTLLGTKEFRSDGMRSAPVPLPAGVWLLISGMLGMARYLRRTKS